MSLADEQADAAWSFDTLAVRAGQERSQFNEHSEALYLTSSFLFETAASKAQRAVEERRPEYTQILSRGLARFFEPRRETCPLCVASYLRPTVQVRDLLQRKRVNVRACPCPPGRHPSPSPRRAPGLRPPDRERQESPQGPGHLYLESV